MHHTNAQQPRLSRLQRMHHAGERFSCVLPQQFDQPRSRHRLRAAMPSRRARSHPSVADNLQPGFCAESPTPLRASLRAPARRQSRTACGLRMLRAQRRPAIDAGLIQADSRATDQELLAVALVVRRPAKLRPHGHAVLGILQHVRPTIAAPHPRPPMLATFERRPLSDRRVAQAPPGLGLAGPARWHRQLDRLLEILHADWL